MIAVTREGHVTTLEMQRPERRNALNAALVDGLREVDAAQQADAVRADVARVNYDVFRRFVLRVE